MTRPSELNLRRPIAAENQCGPASIRSGVELARGALGFTLIEIIVVVLILSIAAGVFLPRLAGNADRRAQTEAEGVRELLTILAEQQSDIGTAAGTSSVAEGVEARGSADVAIKFDPETNTVGLVRRIPGGRKGEWTDEPDRLVSPVNLSECVISQVVLDGRVLTFKPGEPFRLDVAPRQLRPTLSLVLAKGSARTGGGGNSASERSWQIDLPATNTAATMRELPSGTTAADALQTDAVDLDLTGAGDSPW
jgi:prepilin-type N-terminal cleavage/methylation domain-containing protein